MGKFNALLNLRLKSKNLDKPKMTALAERANKGELSSFSGVFRVAALSDKEKEALENILRNFSEGDQNVHEDLQNLMSLTSEVRAITNQAVILHGERIKKAQEILKKYRDGAFTAWLITTYGNRQTPYNFLQYYEFYISMPSQLHSKLDEMPRQAVYTLASRPGEIEQKEEIVRNYQGQPKQELLTVIRTVFPLSYDDKRRPNYANQSVHALRKLHTIFKDSYFEPTKRQKQLLLQLIDDLKELIQQKDA